MRSFIESQHVFFVGTAPSERGHINLSPKGYDSFQIVGPTRVAYLDMTGSGAETIAHLRDNGRITFMFCAFEGRPNIVRLYGTGRVVLPGEETDDDLSALNRDRHGARSVIVADIHRTSSSCGFGVPFMEYTADRPTLTDWAGRMNDEQLADYRVEKNAVSIDGLPAVD